MIVSGCVASFLNWERFDTKWRKLLNRADVTYIRAHELIKGKGEFNGVGTPVRVKAAKDIDKAMTKHIKFGFSTVLWQRDFAAYRDATKSGLNSLLYSDYGVSFRVILSFIHSHMTKIYDDPAVYVLYEMGHENEGAPGAVFAQYLRDFPDGIIKSVAPIAKGSSYGAQAADIRGCLVRDMEREADPQRFSNLKQDDGSIREYFENIELPWFRLPIGPETLVDLRNQAILSKERFRKLYGHLLLSVSPESSR
jgi:hypothetical protein